jgi:hypothetical protein
MPVNDVGGPVAPVQSRIPDTPAKTEGIPAAAPITEESLQTAIDKARPEAKGDPATTVTKIEQTENKDIVIVTTADGSRVPFSTSAWSAGVQPDYDPANPGVFKPIGAPNAPEKQPGVIDDITDYLKGLFKTKATREAEAADAALKRQNEKIKQDDAKKAELINEGNYAGNYGLPADPELWKDPGYREAYKAAVTARNERAAAKANENSGSSNNESKGKGGDNGPSDSNENEIKETGDTKDGDTVYKAGNAKMV